MVEGGKYMIPKTWMSERQVLKMVEQTPKQHVYTRPGKGGQVWTYVTGAYVEKVLNYVFGWNWDFEIVKQEEAHNQVVVTGRLTVKDNAGHAVTKMQIGRADIKYKKDTKETLDFGNDIKAAATDALKKCASLLGVASDIYGRNEFKEDVGVNVPDKGAKVIPALPAPKSKNEPDIVLCLGPNKKGCPTGNPVSKAGEVFTKRIYGYALCKECAQVMNDKKNGK